jgi:hypothetical protein
MDRRSRPLLRNVCSLSAHRRRGVHRVLGPLARPITRVKPPALACLWLRPASSLGGLTATPLGSLATAEI